MSLVAPPTSEPVKPISVQRQGSVWTALGSLAGLLVTLLPVAPLPDPWRPWLPFTGALLGWLAHQFAGPDEYQRKSG